MQIRNLGGSGLRVSAVGLGCNNFGQRTDLETSRKVIHKAIDLGVTLFDTADIYAGMGGSETVLGEVLGDRRKDIVLATKFSKAMARDGSKQGASRRYIMSAVEASLTRLKTDYIDLYQQHDYDALTPIDETLRALDDLIRQGKVRYIGVSNWQAWKIAKALAISESRNLARFDTLQAYYSIAGRDLERELVPLLEESKTGLLVWSPLAGGLLSGKFSRENQQPQDSRRSAFDFPLVDKDRTWRILEAMAPIAKAHACSPARIALAWLLAKPVVTSIIIGARRLDQLHDNLAAVELRLTQDEVRSLDEVSALPAEYPGWMLPFQGGDRLGVRDRPLWETRVPSSGGSREKAYT